MNAMNRVNRFENHNYRARKVDVVVVRSSQFGRSLAPIRINMLCAAAADDDDGGSSNRSTSNNKNLMGSE